MIVGENADSTVTKALGLVGLGRDRVCRVPADDQGRMRADCLPEDVTGPAVICAQAGEVNTGAFDPFPAILQWARRHEAWVHVDGAFGLWALAILTSHVTAGLADADSWATDAHKWLNVPYDSGIALVRRPRTCAAASPRPLATSPRCRIRGHQSHATASQRARQVEVWAAAHPGPPRRGRSGRAQLPSGPDDGRPPGAGRAWRC